MSWLDRARWIALAAIPSGLLLGVATYVLTDIGSAPFHLGGQDRAAGVG